MIQHTPVSDGGTVTETDCRDSIAVLKLVVGSRFVDTVIARLFKAVVFSLISPPAGRPLTDKSWVRANPKTTSFAILSGQRMMKEQPTEYVRISQTLGKKSSVCINQEAVVLLQECTEEWVVAG